MGPSAFVVAVAAMGRDAARATRQPWLWRAAAARRGCHGDQCSRRSAQWHLVERVAFLPAYPPHLPSACLAGIHGPFDLVSQFIQMRRKAIEHVPLRLVS